MLLILQPFLRTDEIVELSDRATLSQEYAITNLRFLCATKENDESVICSISWSKVSGVKVSAPKITLRKFVAVYGSGFKCVVEFGSGQQDKATDLYFEILERIDAYQGE